VKLFKDPAGCGTTLPLQTVKSLQIREFAAESAAAAETGARVVDLRSVLCPGSQCSTNRGGFWIYRDGLHISPAESQRLAPVFASALRP
jgi:hypothetical protein